MHEIEHLISAVQQRPCLWDLNHQDYHNRDVKEEAWQDIARQITSNWDQLDKTTKYETCLTFKKKWTNIRDSFRKELHSSGKLPSGSRKRKYKYANQLKFLKPSIRVRQLEPLTDTNNESSEEDSDQEDKPSRRKIQVVSIQQEFKEDRASPTASYPEICLSPTSIPTSREYVNTMDMNDTFNAQTQMSKLNTAQTEDDDTKFLLSFRGDMKTMNQSQKIDFKIGMLRLIQKILHHDGSDPNGASNSSSYVMCS